MSKWRSLASQLCAIFPYVCLEFADGSFTGYHIILIGELHRKNSEIPATLDQLSWFASLSIIQPVGTIATGFLTQPFGSRSMAFTGALLFITSLLSFHFSTTITAMFVGQIFLEFLATKSIANPHISEISEPQYRGPFLAIIEFVASIGSFFSLLLSNFLHWRTIAFINLVFPILAAIFMLITPHSPSWLVSKSRLVEAEKALCWVRGWVKPEEVQTEFHSLVESVQKSKNKLEKQSKLDGSESPESQDISKKSSRPYFLRSFYVPLGTMCSIGLLYTLTGAVTVTSYATVIFRELESPIEESAASTIMGAMRILGGLIIMFIIRRTGKRKLMFFSLIITAFCYASVAVVGLLRLQNMYLWIPPISLFVFRFVNAMGIGPIVFMLPSETFPSSTRYIGTSLSLSAKIVGQSTMKKLFLYFVEAVTLPGVFLFFAVMNLVALFVYYFLVPETEGKSLQEIADDFESVQTIREPKK